MHDQAQFAVGWGTLSLINAGLAQSKGRSGLLWWLVSLFIGPIATFLIVVLAERSARCRRPLDLSQSARRLRSPGGNDRASNVSIICAGTLLGVVAAAESPGRRRRDARRGPRRRQRPGIAGSVRWGGQGRSWSWRASLYSFY